MMIELNGERREVEPGLTLADAVELAGAAAMPRGVAAAVGGEVIPRSDWKQRELAEGDAIEVLRAVQGG